MEDYNKVIESLGIRYLKSSNHIVADPFRISLFCETDNAILLLKRGQIFYGPEEKLLQEGQALFIPSGGKIDLSFGDPGELKEDISMEEFAFRRAEFFMPPEGQTQVTSDFTIVVFETRVFDTVNFFQTLDIPSFVLDNSRMNSLIFEISKEQSEQQPGFQRVIKLRTESLCIELVRHILGNGLFAEQIKTNSTYFKDPRLVSLLNYIKENLDGELTNKRLAEVAKVSEDYVGQYFKSLTGINPQDYIEYQRMEYAVELLRTTKQSIRDIATACGYKDTAYFCRRFKMMYGVPAGKMRKRETLMNV